MKNKKIIVLFSFVLFLISGCGLIAQDRKEKSEQEVPEEIASEQKDSNVVSENQLGGDYYRPALDENDRYMTSKNRGITLNLNSGINLSLFEKDLMRFSQKQFPTDKNFIQEGQYLSKDEVSSWLQRKSSDNPEGLNPEDSGDEDNRTPRYLNSILELDFFEENDGKLNLSGISIGLALNSVDYYPAYQFGPTLEQEIPEGDILKEGQKIADELVQRIRDIEQLSTIPIHVGLYQQSPRDDLAGGVYIAEGTSTDGSTEINKWEKINEKRVIFPLEGADSAEGNAFANFQSEVESFFPNISGLTGRGHYVDDRLERLSIEIMTQFYGESEMVSYSQYLKQSAATFLPSELDVEIIVESPTKVEAFLKKDRTESEYFSYIFD